MTTDYKTEKDKLLELIGAHQELILTNDEKAKLERSRPVQTPQPEVVKSSRKQKR